MMQALNGRYVVSGVGGERVKAFVPDSLPPKQPIKWDTRRLERATLALGRPDVSAFGGRFERYVQ